MSSAAGCESAAGRAKLWRQVAVRRMWCENHTYQCGVIVNRFLIGMPLACRVVVTDATLSR